MKRVTRNIDPREARDLLEHVPRACIAFAADGGPSAHPVSVVFQSNRYLVGAPFDASSRPAEGQEVVLLVDEGVEFFDLRAIYVRGRIEPAQKPNGFPDQFSWFAIAPSKVAAWDYGRMREEEHEP
jgi:hypothetical protein